MKRLFNASPGFFNKRSPSSCQSHSKMNEYKKLVSSESRFDVCSHSQLPNFSGMNFNKAENNSKSNIYCWESQQFIKTNNSKGSRDESNEHPKYKTLDDGNADQTDNKTNIKALNIDPQMKRSKTPSTYIKPHRIRNIKKKKIIPSQYNSRFSSSGKGVMLQEPNNYYLMNCKNSGILMNNSKGIESKNSSTCANNEVSKGMLSKFTKLSSISRLQSMIDFNMSRK